MQTMKERKLVYQYDAGDYYAWMGESTACKVDHRTNSIFSAQDFSGYLIPEEILPNEKGKLIWVTGSLRKKDYKTGDISS